MSFSHPPVVITMTCLAKNAMNFVVLSWAPEGVKVIEELFHSNPPRIAKDLRLGEAVGTQVSSGCCPCWLMISSGIINILVGGFNHLEKYWSMGRIFPYIMENKKCSKPPTSIYIYTTQYIGNYNNPRTGNPPFSVHFQPDKSKVQWVFSIAAHLHKSHGPPSSPTLYSIIQ